MDLGPTIDLLVKFGPYALFIYAEMRRREERDERIKTQESLAEYLKKDIDAKDGIARSIRSLAFNAFRHGALPADGLDGEKDR